MQRSIALPPQGSMHVCNINHWLPKILIKDTLLLNNHTMLYSPIAPILLSSVLQVTHMT